MSGLASQACVHAVLEGRPVLDTIRRAFDAMAGLL